MGFLCRAQERNVWTLAQIERYSMCRLRLPPPSCCTFGARIRGRHLDWGRARARSGTSLRLPGHRSGTNGRRTWVRVVGVEGGRPDSAACRNWLSSLLCIDFDFKSSSSSSAAFSISWLIVSHAAFAARVQERQTRGSGKGAARECIRLQWHIKFHN